jgi:hypothetical protein
VRANSTHAHPFLAAAAAVAALCHARRPQRSRNALPRAHTTPSHALLLSPPDKAYYQWLLVKVLRFLLRNNMFAGPENWFAVKLYFRLRVQLFSLGARLLVGVELLSSLANCSAMVRIGTPADARKGKAVPPHVLDVSFLGTPVLSVNLVPRTHERAAAAAAATRSAAAAAAAAAPPPAPPAEPSPPPAQAEEEEEEEEDTDFDVVMDDTERAEMAQLGADYAANRAAEKEEGITDEQAEEAAAAAALEEEKTPLPPLPPEDIVVGESARNPFHLVVTRRGKARRTRTRF